MKYTKEQLQEAVNKSYSIFGVLRELNIRQTGGSHCHIKRKIIALGIDTSHFTGQGHNKGKRSPNKKTWQEVLIVSKTGRREHSYKLRRALIEYGKEYKCIGCGNTGEWLGKPITLEVNHINNDWQDHRPCNLEFRCPNCHSQYKK